MTAQQPVPAPDDRTDDEVREELRNVEADLVELRRTARDMRTRIGSRSDGPLDAEEQAAALTAADEQEALIDALETRRDALRRRLGGD